MSTSNSASLTRSASTNFGLFIARVAYALPVLYHGSAILFGKFGGPGPQGFAAYLHIPLSVAYLVGLAQFGGGLAILTGVLFRIGAAGVIVVMVGAINLVHLPHGYNIANNGMEFALTVLLLALALQFTGPGSYSLQGILPGPLRKL